MDVNKTMASILEQAIAARDNAHRERGQLLDSAATEKRSFTDAEESKYQSLGTYHQQMVERVSQLERSEKAENNRAALNVKLGVGSASGANGEPRFHTSSRGGTYFQSEGSPSFFRDILSAKSGDYEASQRLHTNNMEQRAGLNTRLTSGGDFSPPGWLQDFVPQARAGAVTSTLVHNLPLPPNVSSLQLPRITSGGGTTVAVQVNQGDTVSNVDPVTDHLSSGITTIAGGSLLSNQLIDQAGNYGSQTIDEIIFNDLSEDYYRKLNTQVLTGTGANNQLLGIITASVAGAVNNLTWTQASPTPSLLFSQLGRLSSAVAASRWKPITAFVMAPRRFAWIASSTDTAGRPFVNAEGVNTLATQTKFVAQGLAGRIQGIPVYVDACLPLNLGTGTNQDPILGIVAEDIYLWTSPIQATTFTAPYANSLQTYFRLHSYAAMIPNRYVASLGQLYGTVGVGSSGLAGVTFAG